MRSSTTTSLMSLGLPDLVSVEQRLTKAWDRDSWGLIFFVPLSWLLRIIVALRRYLLQAKHQGQPFSAPVVIIGNISVGGSGKTPLIIALVKALKQRGYSIGVVSRGYGAKADGYPLAVTGATKATQCGDEPLLIAQTCSCPVVVDPDRVAAVNYLLAQYQCDLVLSDDGLQHYRLHRDIEVAVIDGMRGLGNGRCLPAGPLREPRQRLYEVDYILLNGSCDISLSDEFNLQEITLQPSFFRHLASGKTVAATDWAQGPSVHAVAAIGNPQRFAVTLAEIGLDADLTSVDDHRQLCAEDLNFGDSLPVIITAKDAVKFTDSVADNIWVLEVEMVLPDGFLDSLTGSAGLEAGNLAGIKLTTATMNHPEIKS
jgi:tetraacyldisaccharide 4'-kinase